MTVEEWMDQTPRIKEEVEPTAPTFLDVCDGSDRAETPHDELVAQIQSQENWLMDF